MAQWPTRMNRNFLVSSALVVLALPACIREEEHHRQGARREPTASRAQALTEEVEDAAQNPSGDVDETRVEGLFEAYADLDYAIGASGMPLDLDPLDLEASSECAVDANGDTLDVSCTTSGAASGTITVDVVLDGGDIYVHYAYDNLCATDRDLCIRGEGAVEVSSSGRIVVAGELTITHDGEASTIKYGVTVDGSVEVVLWHDGESYVVSTDGLEGLGVEGANGQWECDLAGELSPTSAELSGSCSLGDDAFDF
jgi:hypothetical protein